MKCLRTLPVLLGALLASAPALAYVIDGNLADWGVKRTGNASDWVPNSGIWHSIEDQSSDYLNPGYGGQAYDAEAIYVTWDSVNLYIALATGHNPATPDNPRANSYGPGDIAIDMGNNGSWDFGIETTGANKGSLYRVTAWALGLWDANGGLASSTGLPPDPAHPTSILSGVLLGSGTLSTSGPLTGFGFRPAHTHYFYELAIPLGLFGTGWTGMDFTVHWTQNCANDAIQVTARGFPGHSVPEPGTLALLPLGLLGLLALRRRSSAQ
jgi:hypothetical protein